jgi:hypothetical protein
MEHPIPGTVSVLVRVRVHVFELVLKPMPVLTSAYVRACMYVYVCVCACGSVLGPHHGGSSTGLPRVRADDAQVTFLCFCLLLFLAFRRCLHLFALHFAFRPLRSDFHANNL